MPKETETMQKLMFAVIAIGALAVADGALARGGVGEAGEAEAARMHAKAGGPTNDRDRWLLKTYGCRDKRDSEYCWYLYEKQRGSLKHAKKYRRN
jgi:hypothetical protein